MPRATSNSITGASRFGFSFVPTNLAISAIGMSWNFSKLVVQLWLALRRICWMASMASFWSSGILGRPGFPGKKSRPPVFGVPFGLPIVPFIMERAALLHKIVSRNRFQISRLPGNLRKQMTLLKVTKLVPVQNEKREVYRWDTKDVWLNPENVQSATTQPFEVAGSTQEYLVVSLYSGVQLIIEERSKDFDRLFRLATIDEATHSFRPVVPFWFYFQHGLLIALFLSLVYLRLG